MKIDGQHAYAIQVCSRVILYCNDRGFRFAHALHKPEKLDKWENWQYYWQLYRRDGIYRKCMDFLSSLPDHKKSGPMYQSMSFKD